MSSYWLGPLRRGRPAGQIGVQKQGETIRAVLGKEPFLLVGSSVEPDCSASVVNG